MSKKSKKNLKKVHAKIDNTPVKTEATKKEESKVANKKVNGDEVEKLAEKLTTESLKNASKKELKSIIATAKKAGNKELVKKAKEEKEKKKYAASKARIEARKARKKERADKLAGIQKTKASEPDKITLEQRKELQENRRKVAYNRHISSIRRRCKRMKLSDEQTNVIIDNAKAQWDAAKQYDIVIVYDSSPKKKTELEKLVKDTGITSACITGSTAFLKNVPKDVVDKIRELLVGDTIYQYRTDKEDLFKDYENNHTPKKPSGNKTPHSRPCSKSRNINFYNLRRLKKAAKEALGKSTHTFKPGSKAEGRKLRRKLKAKAKAVNKKPTQVKEVKQKTAKQAA